MSSDCHTMAVQLSIKKSEVSLPFQASRHELQAVTWNATTIVWGDINLPIDVELKPIYFHTSGKWIQKITSGDKPPCRRAG